MNKNHGSQEGGKRKLRREAMTFTGGTHREKGSVLRLV